ncbi:PAS domain-containing protein [Halapricum desulfuricans]|nr:PAS domain-containing protein [Halapricum desulfuricans]
MASEAGERHISTLVVTADQEFATACRTRLPPHADIDVTVVETVGKAIDVFVSRDRLDCIISDHDLPDTDGIAFLEIVRAQAPTLPFVLFTSHGSEQVASRAISADVTEYLIKESHADQWERLASLIEDAVTYYRNHSDLIDPGTRAQTLLDAVHDGIVVLRDGHVEYINNPGTELIAAKSRSSLIGRAIGDVLDVEERRSLSDILAAIQRRDRSFDRFKARLQRQNGAVLPVEITITAAEWTGSAATILVVRDVSEHEEREQDLWLKNRAMDNAPIGITIADADNPDRSLIYVNDQFEQLTGYSKDEALGANCRFLQGADTDPAAVREMRDAIDAQESVRVQIRNYREDGTEFWNQVTLAPVRNADGDVTHYIGFQEDVTEQVVRERRLRQYEYAIESTSDLIAAVDEDYQFLFANQAYRDFYDLDADEVTDRALPDVVGTETWETIQPYVDRSFTGESIQFEMTRSRPDQPTRSFDVRYHPLKGVDDETGGTMATMRDITDQRERERQLASLDRMLRHTLHNELNVITGRAEMIAERTSGEVTQWAGVIDRVADRILEQADKERDIVDFLSQPSTPTEIDVSEMVVDVADRMETRHPDADISVDVADDLHLLTLPELERALEELVENAVVHNDGTPVTVAVSADTDETTVTLTVEDNGPGIPDEERRVIVDNADIEPLLHSSGMGLWLVKRIITRAGGTLQFDAGDTGGSRVTLVVPRRGASGRARRE